MQSSAGVVLYLTLGSRYYQAAHQFYSRTGEIDLDCQLVPASLLSTVNVTLNSARPLLRGVSGISYPCEE